MRKLLLIFIFLLSSFIAGLAIAGEYKDSINHLLNEEQSAQLPG